MSKQLRSITVRELLEQLEEFNEAGYGEHKVVFAYNANDHWRTPIAATIEGTEEGEITYSEYHQTYKQICSEEADELREFSDEEDAENVIFLNCGVNY
jgi:hypothetical protein